MTERGDALKMAMYGAEWDEKEKFGLETVIARAICEHVGLTWDVVDRCCVNQTIRDIAATLLEAAEIER